MKNYSSLALTTAQTSARRCRTVRANDFDYTSGNLRGTDDLIPCRWKMVDLHPKSALVWLANRLLFENLHLFLPPDLFFFLVWVKKDLLIGISRAAEFYSAFYIISSLSWKQRNVMTIAFVPRSGLSFGPLRLFPIVRCHSLRLSM